MKQVRKMVAAPASSARFEEEFLIKSVDFP
jgi:hypothetical protein